MGDRAGEGGRSVHPPSRRAAGIANDPLESSLSHSSRHRLSSTIIHAGSRPRSPLLISTYLHILLKIKILLHFSQGSVVNDLFSQPYLTPISWDNKAAAVGGLLTNAQRKKMARE